MVFLSGLFLFCIILIFCIVKGFIIVKIGRTVIIERLGKYYRTLKPGFNFIIPLIDSPKLINDFELIETSDGRFYNRIFSSAVVDLREKVYYISTKVYTKDESLMIVDILLYYQIVTPYDATYKIENLPIAIEKYTQINLRNIFAQFSSDEIFDSKIIIINKLKEMLNNSVKKWGVKLNHIDIQDIQFS